MPIPSLKALSHLKTTAALLQLLAVAAGRAHAQAALPSAPPDAERYEARAYARADGQLRYTETHWRYQDGGVWQHLVLYGCPGEAAVFARKRLRESPSAEAPDFDFQDARDGYREGVRSRKDLREGQREVYVQAKAGSAMDTRIVAIPPGAVLDAGFDHFVRAHWPALSAGGSAEVPFLIPSRFDFLDFKIADARDAQAEGEPVRRLRMKFAAWWGFALPSIELAYTRDGRRLVEFQGLGTIRDAQGRNQDVRIVFPAAQRASAPSMAEIEAALARPLVSRCPPP